MSAPLGTKYEREEEERWTETTTNELVGDATALGRGLVRVVGIAGYSADLQMMRLK